MISGTISACRSLRSGSKCSLELLSPAVLIVAARPLCVQVLGTPFENNALFRGGDGNSDKTIMLHGISSGETRKDAGFHRSLCFDFPPNSFQNHLLFPVQSLLHIIDSGRFVCARACLVSSEAKQMLTPPCAVNGSVPVGHGMYVGGIQSAAHMVHEGLAASNQFKFIFNHCEWAPGALERECAQVFLFGTIAQPFHLSCLALMFVLSRSSLSCLLGQRPIRYALKDNGFVSRSVLGCVPWPRFALFRANRDAHVTARGQGFV